MMIIVFGTDTYRSRKRLRALVDAFKKKFDPHGYNVSRFEGQHTSFDDIQVAFGTMSFLASKRMIVFEDFLSAKTSEKQKQIFEYLVTRDSDEHIIVFWQAGNLPGASGRLKIIKQAKLEEFQEFEEPELILWIRTEARARNLALDARAGRLLVERVGPDLWSLSNVLDQLSAYTQAKKTSAVTGSMVTQFTSVAYDENIFHLTDALAQKNVRVALELLFDQLESGGHPLYVLTMLVRQFRMLVQLAGPNGSQLSAGDIGAHPYAVQKARETLQFFSLAEILRAYRMLEEIDIKLKTGEKDAETLFSRFIYTVAGN